MAAAHAVNALNMLSWVPHHGLAPILRGERDEDIRAYAQAIGGLGYPILVRFGHEMNLPGSGWFGEPQPFIAAWRRVHASFREYGVTNALWVWCPYVLDRGMRRFEPYHPGDDAVDVVGLDGYNWGRRRWWQRWPGFDAIFSASYAELRRVAPEKPMVLAEIGCAEAGGDKAAWMREAFLDAIPARYPAIEAVISVRPSPSRASRLADGILAGGLGSLARDRGGSAPPAVRRGAAGSAQPDSPLTEPDGAMLWFRWKTLSRVVAVLQRGQPRQRLGRVRMAHAGGALVCTGR